MRLATFNILYGASPLDRTVDLDRFAAAIASLDADVLALQEVDRAQTRSGTADLTAIAAEAMGAVAYRFVPVLTGGAPDWAHAGDQDVPGQPAFGNALLSRYPASGWQLHRMPRLRVPMPHPTPDRRRLVAVPDEPRILLTARLATPLGPVTVGCVHLSFLVGWARFQLREAVRRLADAPDPVVLMGDFNISGGAPARLSRFRTLARHRTYPVARPNRQLDHILLRGDLGRVVSTAAPELAVSDHRALVVEVAEGAVSGV